MRRWICAALLVGMTMPAPAAPVPGLVPAPPSKAERISAAVERNEIVLVVDAVAAKYVRHVSRKDLFAAALTGLHDAAQVPLPADLLRHLEDAESDLRCYELIEETLCRLNVASDLRGGVGLLAACRGIARRLDAHCAVVEGTDLRRGIGVDEQQGFGLEVEQGATVNSPLKVIAVHPGGPAQAAGLRPGDVITHIDGGAIKDSTLGAIRQLIPDALTDENIRPAGGPEPKDELTVTAARPGERPLTATLQRTTFQPETVLGVVRRGDNSWSYWLDPKQKTALIRVSGMGNTTALDVRKLLEKLIEEGLRGLVLDLRWCPGGYLRQAVQIASLFLPHDATIATVTSRPGVLSSESMIYKNLAETTYRDFPIVVLVNGESSGGAEMIAAALQDHKRAVVAGSRTVGKGSVQMHLPLGDQAGFKLTVQTITRPSGKAMQRFSDSKADDDWGVRPNEGLVVKPSPDLDRQLKEWWLLQTLRPGGGRERLPLDDLTADPQLQLAQDELARKLAP